MSFNVSEEQSNPKVLIFRVPLEHPGLSFVANHYPLIGTRFSAFSCASAALVRHSLVRSSTFSAVKITDHEILLYE